jgi:hypothetical protein
LQYFSSPDEILRQDRMMRKKSEEASLPKRSRMLWIKAGPPCAKASERSTMIAVVTANQQKYSGQNGEASPAGPGSTNFKILYAVVGQLHKSYLQVHSVGFDSTVLIFYEIHDIVIHRDYYFNQSHHPA